MRYVIVDLDGSSCGYYDTFDELLREIDEIRGDEPEMIPELAVLAYEDGERVGQPMPAERLVPQDATELEELARSVAEASGVWTFSETLMPA